MDGRQVLFDGGDGALYQCADLTLDDSAQQGALGPPCTKNITSASATQSTSAPPSKNTNTALRSAGQSAFVLGLVGVVAVLGVVML